MDNIFAGILIGSLFGYAVWWAFVRKSSRQQRNDNTINIDRSEYLSSNVNRRGVMDRWSVRLAIGGFALGAFFAFTKGWATIGFMVGFGLPFSAIGLVVGLVIDFFKNRKH
jgi:hypothetical protein